MAVLVLGLTVGCGDDARERAEALFPSGPPIEQLAELPFDADSLLPAGEGIVLVEPVSVRRADAIAADRANDKGYLAYDIIGTATSSYQVDGVPVRLEIAQFAEPIEAYGWYSVHRPNGAATDTIGRQSFRQGTVRYVFKGDYVMVLETMDTSLATLAVSERLARLIAGRVSREARLSPYHILFPMHDRVAASDRYYGYGFLGVERLNEVYTMDFASGVDTARWFLAPDTSGLKFVVFKEWAEEGTRRRQVPPVLPFEQGQAVYVEHPEFGGIIAGLAANKLVGVIGYRPEKQERKLGAWLEGLRK